MEALPGSSSTQHALLQVEQRHGVVLARCIKAIRMWTGLVQDRTIVLVEHDGIQLAAFGAELVDAAQARRMRFSRIGQQEGAGPRGGVVQQGQHALLVFPRERLNALAGATSDFGGFFARDRHRRVAAAPRTGRGHARQSEGHVLSVPPSFFKRGGRYPWPQGD